MTDHVYPARWDDAGSWIRSFPGIRCRGGTLRARNVLFGAGCMNGHRPLRHRLVAMFAPAMSSAELQSPRRRSALPGTPVTYPSKPAHFTRTLLASAIVGWHCNVKTFTHIAKSRPAPFDHLSIQATRQVSCPHQLLTHSSAAARRLQRTCIIARVIIEHVGAGRGCLCAS